MADNHSTDTTGAGGGTGAAGPSSILDAFGGDVDAALGTIVTELDRVSQAVTDLDQTVASMAAGDAAAQVDLSDWVAWVRLTYNAGDVIPTTWAGIRGMAPELAAFHAWWCAAHKTDGTPRLGPAAQSWHDAWWKFIGNNGRASKLATDHVEKNGQPPMPPPWLDSAGS